MKKLALALAATGMIALGNFGTPAVASVETYEAKAEAANAAAYARDEIYDAFGDVDLRPGKFHWRKVPESAGPERVVISLGDQLAYVYRGNTLMAVSTISSGTETNPTPTGIFNIHTKKTMHRSKKYENAPMPFAQFIDEYGIALHAGHLPGRPASHGCIRLPSQFAAKLYGVTGLGTTVMIGA